MNRAIIGCGYLGLEVAKLWTKKGSRVTATTRSPEKLDEISKAAQKGVILKGNDPEEIAPLILNNETLLIAIAADAPEHYENAYSNTAQIFRQLALEFNLPRTLIYISSTSIYGDHKGLWVDETSDLLGKGERNKILIDAEKYYLSLGELGWSVCILRLAEIYGPGRELSSRVRQLIGHSLPGSGRQYTNLAHQTDCVQAIDFVHRHNCQGIYNIADDDHPTRKDLYDQVAKKFSLPPVHWDPTLKGLHSGNKRVSNHKIKAEGFTFHYPHRILN